MTWHETSKEYQQQDCEGENLLYHDFEIMVHMVSHEKRKLSETDAGHSPSCR